ncbi:hypothetical protein Bbelb_160220 [Branchiostoma belcheri]|nr:hypothetical protein Bbelb_160220 [Branchiostoma belcheri]
MWCTTTTMATNSGDKIFGCIGKNQTLAHRVSDWEHMTIRLVSKTPSSIYVDSAETSSGNHKLWPSSATRTFMARLIKTLKDETGAGTAWDTWKNVRFTMYRPDGGYTGNWTWMNFKGLWGNKEVGCNFLIGQCTLNNGLVTITRMKPMKTDELD